MNSINDFEILMNNMIDNLIRVTYCKNGEVSVNVCFLKKYSSEYLIVLKNNVEIVLWFNSHNSYIKTIESCSHNIIYLLIYKYDKMIFDKKNNQINSNNIFNIVYDDNHFYKYNRVYSFTNEFINIFIDKLNVNDKKILTCLGSGDFNFNFLLKGAKKVDSFDVNKYAIDYYKLKKYLISKCNYNEFLNLIINPDKIINIIKKDKAKIEESVYNLFSQVFFSKDNLINFFYNSSRGLFKKDNDKRILNILKYKNLYLNNKNNYNLLKNMLLNNDDELFNESIDNLFLNDKYDILYLSNIGDYLNIENINLIIKKMLLNLTDNGKIYMLFRTDKYKKVSCGKVVNIDFASEIDKYNLKNDNVIPEYEKNSILYEIEKTMEDK